MSETLQVLKLFRACKQKGSNRLTFLKNTVSGKVKHWLKEKNNPVLTVKKWLCILELGVPQSKLQFFHLTVFKNVTWKSEFVPPYLETHCADFISKMWSGFCLKAHF